MNTHKKVTLALFALTLIAIGTPLAAAQGNGVNYQYTAGMVTLDTEEISIKVTGNNQPPHFHWWDPNNPTVDYHVMFAKMYEVNDTNENGVYDHGTDMVIGAPFALPTSGWDFSGFEVEETGGNVTAIHFNFTTTSTFDPRPEGTGADYGQLPNLSPFDVYVEIRVHLNLANPGEMKFDLVVDGWEWTYDDSMLVLQFTLSESNHGQAMGTRDAGGLHKTGTKFEFRNGYFEYNETALAAQNQLEVRASYGGGDGVQAGQAIYLAFEYFGNETLVYDPIIGIAPEGFSVDPVTVGLIAGGLIIVLLVAVVIKRK